MAIASLKKVTLVGVASEKDIALRALQELGVVHLIDISSRSVNAKSKQTDPFEDNRAALAFLEACPLQQRPLRKLPKQFQPDVAIAQVLKLKAKSEQLKDESEHIHHQIAKLEPWGEFKLPTPAELHGLQIFFYTIPTRSLKKIVEADLTYEVVSKDSRTLYVVVIADKVPDLPFSPVSMPPESLSTLQEQLEFTLDELEKCETRRIGETRFIKLLREHLNLALDNSELLSASQKAYDDTGLFALQGWCSVKLVESLQELAMQRSLAIEIDEPSPDETPPTFLENHGLVQPGEPLISLYGIPGYHTWDPSMVVYFSFIIFFAMIVDDTGYGAILLVIALFLRSKLIKDGNGKFFLLSLALSISTITYGIISGTYFGWTPPEANPLRRLMVFDSADLKNLPYMMAASILIGCVHICLANLISLYNNRHSQKAWSYLGWIVVVLCGYFTWLAQFFWSQPAIATFLLYGVGAGLGLVFLFSHPAAWTSKGISHRFLGGIESLLHISKVFGDVLSYLRLFALGLSSTYLAITFNQLAHDASKIEPLGFLWSFVVIIVGHTINFALGMLGGVIHGLRLNFIEFYNWSLPGEGFVFNPFRKNAKN